MKTHLGIQGDRFTINGKLTYAEIPGVNEASLGLLWNQRLVQGVFDDAQDRSRFDQFKAGVFDPERNTQELIAALPEWYAHGMRAITVCFQGGWPVGHVPVETIENNPFGADGCSLDPAYACRMDKIIRAADELGMIVIVSLLYWAQANRLTDGRAVMNAVKTGGAFLRDGGYTNVILEVANEYSISPFKGHPIIHEAEGMAALIAIAREASGGVPVGCSGGGGEMHREVAEASDVVIVHGNGQTRGEYYDFLRKVKDWAKGKPVLCNEDSPCATRVDVALETGTSWGYYNNYTKQMPPADYGITQGEDTFFARRIARAVGIPVPELPESDQYVLQGLEAWTEFGGMRTIRLAADFPETVDYVDFYLDGEKIYRNYDEPFFLDREATWLGTPRIVKPGSEWMARVRLCNGKVIEKTAKAN